MVAVVRAGMGLSGVPISSAGAVAPAGVDAAAAPCAVQSNPS